MYGAGSGPGHRRSLAGNRARRRTFGFPARGRCATHNYRFPGSPDSRPLTSRVGTIFGNYLAAAIRNPSAAQGQFANLIFGFAVTEALGIFSLLVALLLLFVF